MHMKGSGRGNRWRVRRRCEDAVHSTATASSLPTPVGPCERATPCQESLPGVLWLRERGITWAALRCRLDWSDTWTSEIDARYACTVALP